MFIKNFGLFWRADEVNWHPGQGVPGEFRLLGRIGAIRPVLRLADFREQQGIYVLHGKSSPYSVGLTEDGLGARLRDQHDNNSDKWDRFSWFGVRSILTSTDEQGLCNLGVSAVYVGDTLMSDVIRDVRALLIRAMGLDIAQMNFADAEEWIQVKEHEVEHYLRR